MDRFILSTDLQQKVIKTVHKLGHLSTTKTQQMIRAKYWFPSINAMIDQMIGNCFVCQVTTKDHKQEPIKPSKPSVIPRYPSEEISLDLGEAYPDGHYNLVAIDHRSRYPEVKTVSNQPSKEKLKKMFAHHSIPKQIFTHNGPPFNSKEFPDFAQEEGLYTTNSLLDTLEPMDMWEGLCNKTEQISHLQRKTRNMAVYDMLMAYRDTPHPATGVAPYQVMPNTPMLQGAELSGKFAKVNVMQCVVSSIF